MLEFELRGIPTAYITAAGRVPMVERDGDGFSLSHATGNYLVEGWEDSGPQSDEVHRRLIHFGVHRRMRMSDVKEGIGFATAVRTCDGSILERAEARIRACWSRAWSSTFDGVAGYRVSNCARTLHPWKAMNSMKVWKRPSHRWCRFDGWKGVSSRSDVQSSYQGCSRQSVTGSLVMGCRASDDLPRSCSSHTETCH